MIREEHVAVALGLGAGLLALVIAWPLNYVMVGAWELWPIDFAAGVTVVVSIAVLVSATDAELD